MGIFSNKGRFAVVKKYKNHILLYIIIATIYSAYLFLDFSRETQILIVGAGLISILYTLPIFSKGRRLRDFSFIKIFLIAFVWSFITEGIIINENEANNILFISALVERFCYFIAITIPFDIRDIKIDAETGVITLATILGAKNGLRLSYLLLLISAFIATTYRLDISLYSMIGTYCITAVLIFISAEKRHDYWYTGLLDGSMLLPLLLYLLLS